MSQINKMRTQKNLRGIFVMKCEIEKIVQNVCPALWSELVKNFIQQGYHRFSKEEVEISTYDERKKIKQKIKLSSNSKLRNGEIYSICETIESSSKISIKEAERKIVFNKIAM